MKAVDGHGHKLKDEMGVIKMMIENDQSWQTNTHPQPFMQSGLATPVAESMESTPCQCSADQLRESGTSRCTSTSARHVPRAKRREARHVTW